MVKHKSGELFASHCWYTHTNSQISSHKFSNCTFVYLKSCTVECFVELSLSTTFIRCLGMVEHSGNTRVVLGQSAQLFLERGDLSPADT